MTAVLVFKFAIVGLSFFRRLSQYSVIQGSFERKRPSQLPVSLVLLDSILQ